MPPRCLALTGQSLRRRITDRRFGPSGFALASLRDGQQFHAARAVGPDRVVHGLLGELQNLLGKIDTVIEHIAELAHLLVPLRPIDEHAAIGEVLVSGKLDGLDPGERGLGGQGGEDQQETHAKGAAHVLKPTPCIAPV